MRKLIVGAMVSLDGVMQAPGGPEEDPTSDFSYGGWFWPYFDDTVNQFLDAEFGEPFDLLLGRRTYEIFAAYWPGRQDPIGVAFDKAAKYVATRSDMPLTWDRSIRLKDAVTDISRIKQEDGPNLLTQGSTVLIQSLHRAGLIDEFRLMISPLVLGSGKRLFETGANPAALRLISSSTSPSGVTMAIYQPAGPVIPGNFAQEEPTAAELARREKLRREI